MIGFDLSLQTFLLLLLLLALATGAFLLFLNFKVQPQRAKTQKAKTLAKTCKQLKWEQKKRLYTDYFWSEPERVQWIMLILIFIISLGIAIGSLWSIIVSFIVFIITVAFILFAIRSYKNFPTIAASRLKEFEDKVKAAAEKEISFEGDNIQVFANKDEEFNTQPQLYPFVALSKKPFKKFPKIVAEQKLEFLILSREYFSICQKAATFNLLAPAIDEKKCVEKPASCGECDEYYYSQMRNVTYDAGAKGIRIMYNHAQEDTIIPMAKKDPKVMKAIKEKLRLTERQKLRKIDEHDKYEKIKTRRKPPVTEEKKKEEASKEEK